MKKSFLIILLILTSCSILQKGYTDHNGQYVPKNPNFKFKVKKSCVFPKNLDTTNIYKLTKSFEFGKQVYPSSDPSNIMSNSIYFFKFYKNGRCLGFSITKKDDTGKVNQLKESDLNPNNQYYSKSYYCSEKGQGIKIETFIYGQGFGRYVILDYHLSENGEKLIYQDEHTMEIYQKMKIPSDWKNYSVDW